MTCECDACERMHQWDSNQTVDFGGKTGETVDFATDDAGTAVTVKAENGAAKVPPELLQQTDAIKAYLRNDGNTVAEKTICVEGRAKPSDYVADPTDQLTASEAVEKAQAAAKESATSASYAKDSADAATQFAAEAAGSAEDAADSASKAAASAAAAKSDVNVISPKAVDAPPTAKGVNSIAIGYGAKAAAPRTVALGMNANASGDNSIAIGYNSTATEPGVVSVGTATSKRRITYVSSPTNPYDVATKAYVDSNVFAYLSIDLSSVGQINKGGSVDVTDEEIVQNLSNVESAFNESILLNAVIYAYINGNTFAVPFQFAQTNGDSAGFNLKFLLNVAGNNYSTIYIYYTLSESGDFIVRIKNEGNYDISDLKMVVL